MNRIDRIRSHVAHGSPTPTVAPEEDVVIVSALRTPLTKARRGGFKDTTPDVLLGHVLQAVLKQAKVDPKLVGDVVVGNVLQPGAGAGMARMAQLAAGIPHTVPLHVLNRQCSSGLQAVANVTAAIKAGYYDIGIAAGVESMSLSGMARDAPTVNWERVGAVQDAMDCTVPMGITSENVAEQFGISRTKQDELAALSHAAAAAAQANGWFKEEITPVSTILKDKDGNEKSVIISQDDGLRAGTTVEKLAKLKPAFKEGGSTTAGNSSQVTDGAAAVLLMRRSVAKQMGLPILGRFVSFAVAGVPPAVMGIGPAVAIPEALKKANLTKDQIDVFEINEAFASQAMYCIEKLGIPIEKVNPKGGAIALGHPLGCTGARQVSTLLYQLKRKNQRYGVISMCIGTGMGAAAVFEREL
ncbi:3-ketoacyl-CoA thiolase B, peroxisomal [Phytophthora fragariae]|uniref:acetyl-CoA C-acyltransferase n=1 Tax=Phytophthora fragariae TaxID=53985 RepID=A0A6A3DCF9_9STRA|nr:3-ketoacyl-CoA thiolase B, peroxisomal [Phytophthora fragariae]KAE8919069.1 3-ketoacyl-CoA thiolase B, peroxisomal [Phytophthora fragariae]KAE8964885.1 3-ketoacyl-CoA thiolase B, peroxisomal [Phytophthora fragariae]KAE9060979.1 3-ketoacyl-CoA thiolase B, peroxisomal [Phytophthora fragariae]KAE9061966.1 3-ketoacyl-CoA thiolase B, peroxisomal [Phytophthora fragariae]